MTVGDKKALREVLAKRRMHAHAKVNQTSALDALEHVLSNVESPISFYWPIRTEIDPRPVMHTYSQRVSVCLPITHGYAPLTFRQWREGDDLDRDDFGVPIPKEEAEDLTPRTLVVPMLGFDRRGHRLGYGAGHYDRTLAKLRAKFDILAIGFAFAAQEVDALLPIEPTDQPLNMIVTENGVHRSG